MALLACPPRIHLLPSSSFRAASDRRGFSLAGALSAAPNGLSVSASDRREANDVALVWFKHDLRIDDHPGLVAASRYRRVVPVYVFDHRILSHNSFVKVNLARQDTDPGESPRRSYLKAKRETARTEKEAQIKLKLYEPSEFHVINPSKRTRVGNPVGQKVVSAGTAGTWTPMTRPN